MNILERLFSNSPELSPNETHKWKPVEGVNISIEKLMQNIGFEWQPYFDIDPDKRSPRVSKKISGIYLNLQNPDLYFSEEWRDESKSYLYILSDGSGSYWASNKIVFDTTGKVIKFNQASAHGLGDDRRYVKNLFKQFNIAY
jgi:hypothetical protein